MRGKLLNSWLFGAIVGASGVFLAIQAEKRQRRKAHDLRYMARMVRQVQQQAASIQKEGE